MIQDGLPILIVRESDSHQFVSLGSSRMKPAPPRSRKEHAALLSSQLLSAERVLIEQQSSRTSSIPGALFSVTGTDLAAVAKSLSDVRSGLEVMTLAGEQDAIVYAPSGLSALRRKVDDYRDRDTRAGKPKNNALVARIERIQPATVDSLSFGEISSTEIELESSYLIEAWLPKGPEGGFSPLSALLDHVSESTSEVLDLYSANDRDVALVRLTGQELLGLPAEIPFLAELHIPARVVLVDHAESLDLQSVEFEVEGPTEGSAVVAVHDTGMAFGNPYLDAVTIARDSAVPGETPEPILGSIGSHGAEMAGLAAFGDIAEQLSSGRLTAEARVVAIKLFGDEGQALWAERTRLAVSMAEAHAGDSPVVHSISIGAPNPAADSRSIWSIAIDELAWNEGRGRLIVVAAGNADPITDREMYPDSVFGKNIDHPAQAWNAITVGGVTNLDQLGPEDIALGAADPVAGMGEVSPFTTAGPGGPRPIKPDVVNEAGNSAPGGGLSGVGLQGLSLMTTASPAHQAGRYLSRTWATSAAAAATSNDLAFIINNNRGLRPATIRALLANAANHETPAATQFPSKADRLRAIGYGSVDRVRAAFASSNRPVLYHEGTLAPRRALGAGRGADREVVLVSLPFPDDELEPIHERLVRLSVTLSHFIEPTASLARRDYPGVRLKWDLQGPLETPAEFEARINRLVQEQGVARGQGSYPWEFGENERSRGSLQHDTCLVPASALAGQRLLAVYPVLGWWDYRRESMLKRVDFSVVASIDLGDVDLDIYTPIAVSIEQQIEV